MLHVICQYHLVDSHMPCPCIHAWKMSHVISQHWWQDMHIPCPCVQPLAKVSCYGPTLYSPCAHATSDACKPWLTLYVVGQNLLTDICRKHTMLAGQIRRRQMNVCMPYLTSTYLCVQAKGKVGRPRQTSVDHCVQAKGDARQSIPYVCLPLCVGQRQCMQAMVEIG